MVDPFHTLFGLAAMSMLGADKSLKEINPTFCMPEYVIERLNLKPHRLDKVDKVVINAIELYLQKTAHLVIYERDTKNDGKTEGETEGKSDDESDDETDDKTDDKSDHEACGSEQKDDA